jgi:hypothetical protein
MGSAKRKRLAIGRERLHLRRRGSGKSAEANLAEILERGVRETEGERDVKQIE